MHNILQVLPKTDHIAIVLGASPLERYWKEQIRSAVEPLNDRVSFIWFNDLSFDEMLQRISTLPPRSAVFFGVLTVDAKGVPLIDGQVFSRFRKVSNAPMFSYEDTYFGRGLVGGPMLSVSDISRRAIDAAVRILAGAEPSSIKTEAVGFASPKFDWRELQRWDIQEADLPAGSQVEFREPSFWRQHRWTADRGCCHRPLSGPDDFSVAFRAISALPRGSRIPKATSRACADEPLADRQRDVELDCA